jgi:hypothetical protein
MSNTLLYCVFAEPAVASAYDAASLYVDGLAEFIPPLRVRFEFLLLGIYINNKEYNYNNLLRRFLLRNNKINIISMAKIIRKIIKTSPMVM